MYENNLFLMFSFDLVLCGFSSLDLIELSEIHYLCSVQLNLIRK